MLSLVHQLLPHGGSMGEGYGPVIVASVQWRSFAPIGVADAPTEPGFIELRINLNQR